MCERGFCWRSASGPLGKSREADFKILGSDLDLSPISKRKGPRRRSHIVGCIRLSFFILIPDSTRKRTKKGPMGGRWQPPWLRLLGLLPRPPSGSEEEEEERPTPVGPLLRESMKKEKVIHRKLYNSSQILRHPHLRALVETFRLSPLVERGSVYLRWRLRLRRRPRRRGQRARGSRGTPPVCRSWPRRRKRTKWWRRTSPWRRGSFSSASLAKGRSGSRSRRPKRRRTC